MESTPEIKTNFLNRESTILIKNDSKLGSDDSAMVAVEDGGDYQTGSLPRYNEASISPENER